MNRLYLNTPPIVEFPNPRKYPNYMYFLVGLLTVEFESSKKTIELNLCVLPYNRTKFHVLFHEIFM
jgi:hypothetical protein